MNTYHGFAVKWNSLFVPVIALRSAVQRPYRIGGGGVRRKDRLVSALIERYDAQADTIPTQITKSS